jgi:glycosyltransferase involved in cell wall biosynthesis
MKLLALTEEPDHVCYRYRIEAYAPALAEMGWRLESLPLTLDTLARTRQIRRAAAADLVILQRKLLPLWQLALLRKLARVLVYDFDDAQFHRDSYSPKGPSSWSRLAHFWATVYAADGVFAGNSYLHEQAGALLPPGRVHLVPTCINPDKYPAAVHQRRAGAVKLVWIGQPSTLPCLDMAQSMLAAAAATLPGLELRVISSQLPCLKGIGLVPQAWSSADEAAHLADADIGVSWLPDDPWSRGKCGLKVLQYMAAGLPVVANPVGMNREMVVHGRTGLLAETRQEWAAAIARLANEPLLRRELGTAGRRLVRNRYSVARWAPQFAAIIDRLGRPASDNRPRSPALAGAEDPPPLVVEPVT